MVERKVWKWVAHWAVHSVDTTVVSTALMKVERMVAPSDLMMVDLKAELKVDRWAAPWVVLLAGQLVGLKVVRKVD